MAIALVLAFACVLVLGLMAYEHFAGENPVLDAVYDWQLRHQDVRALDQRTQANPRQSDVIITLTTLPSRINRLAPTIKSLLNQTVSPAAIHLQVPAVSRREQRRYDVPDWLAQLRSVKVCPCDDYGPATKLLPALVDAAPDQRFVVVDDDRIYHRHFIEQMVAHADAHPDVVVAGSGWNAPDDLIDRPSTLGAVIGGRAPVPLHCTRAGQGLEVDLVRGVSGYLVKRRFFDVPALVNYAGAPEAAFFVDDVWISAHCRARKMVLPGRRTNFASVADARFFKPSSLGRINCEVDDASRNNTVMLRYFKDRWKASHH